ncbi:MAG: hypothetical protein AAGC77_13250 [Pseudomonadota bacterium]
MTHDGEYRCPICLREGREGLNTAWVECGVKIRNNVVRMSYEKYPRWLICLPCYKLERPGIAGQPGLIVEQYDPTIEVRLPPSGVYEPDKPIR